MFTYQIIMLAFALLLTPIQTKPSISCEEAVKQFNGYVCDSDKIFGEGANGITYIIKRSSDQELFIMKLVEASEEDPKQEPDYYYLEKAQGSEFIIKIYDTKLHNKIFFQQLEFATRGDLKHFVKEDPLYFENDKNLLVFIKGLIQGLQFLHNKHIVHADYKQHNIVLNDEYVPKLIDFGLSVDLGSKRLSRGDRFYNAPEVLFNIGKKIEWTGQEDIYSLGVVIYWLVHKKLPFDAFSVHQLKRKVSRMTYLFNKGVRLDIVRIIQGCLRYNPNNRKRLGELEDMVTAAMLAKEPHEVLTEYKNCNLDSEELISFSYFWYYSKFILLTLLLITIVVFAYGIYLYLKKKEEIKEDIEAGVPNADDLEL